MSRGINYLHSHSGIERNLDFPKRVVLVDEKYKSLFADSTPNEVQPMRHNDVNYVMVPILDFIRKGGVFKNLDA